MRKPLYSLSLFFLALTISATSFAKWHTVYLINNTQHPELNYKIVNLKRDGWLRQIDTLNIENNQTISGQHSKLPLRICTHEKGKSQSLSFDIEYTIDDSQGGKKKIIVASFELPKSTRNPTITWRSNTGPSKNCKLKTNACEFYIEFIR